MRFIKARDFLYPCGAVLLAASLSGCMVENLGPLTTNATPGGGVQSGNPNAGPDVDTDPVGDTSDNADNTGDNDQAAGFITTSNAPAVANSALQMTELTYRLGLAGGAVITSVDTTAPADSLAGVIRAILTQLTLSVTQQGLQPSVIGAVSTDLTLVCDEGSVGATSQSADSIQFDIVSPCTMNGVALRGSFEITEFDVVGDWLQQATDWSVTALFSFADNFEVTFQTPIDLDGALRYSASLDPLDADLGLPVETGNIIVESPLNITIGGLTRTLNDDFGLQYTYEYNGDAYLLSLEVFGSFSIADFGSTLAVNTGTNNPLEQSQADSGNYHAGSLQVTAEDNTNTSIVAGEDTVNISVNGATLPITDWNRLRGS